MRLRPASLLKEVKVLGELITFTGDGLLNPPRDVQNAKGVLLIPGFMVGDVTLYPLAARLWLAGYRVFFSGTWCNVDCPLRTMDRLEKRLREAHRVTGAKVVVIGHSLGGIYARELARRAPQPVERAILLGAPVKHPIENSNQPIRALGAMMRRVHWDCFAKLDGPWMGRSSKPPEVPETIIYTKSDGIVNWRSCLESGPNVETVEARATHCGLSVSLEAWEVIADRLANSPPTKPAAQPRGGRNPFSPYLHLVKRPVSAA